MAAFDESCEQGRKWLQLRRNQSWPQSFLHSLKLAIEQGELCLHYQPRFDMATGRAHALEALVRWRRPDAGLFYPELFVPAAENHGLIFALDLWVFEQCCRDLPRLRSRLGEGVSLSMNLSVLSCESLYFAQQILEIGKRHAVDLSCFEFEIIESCHIHDIRKVVSFCQTLKKHGARFSLDDFGTGQSPLSNLCQLPIAAVKIDRSFVHGIGESGACETVLQSVVPMCQRLGLLVVAEGIETPAQYAFMSELGCQQLQGFMLSPPCFIERLSAEKMIDRHGG